MQEAHASRHNPRNPLRSALAVLLGAAFTLVVRGYQFGGSNHNVYLLEPLRLSSPPLLAHDWFTTQTLQYHGVFNHLCIWLMRLHVLEPAFLVGYLALVLGLHAGWLRWVKALGGTDMVYLVSVLLFYLSAGGFGLGMYEFLQDSCFLPSNIASVLMLWGLYAWTTGKHGRAGVLLGVAGLFHLNYALVGIGLWSALTLWQGIHRRSRERAWLVGTLALLGLCLPNILPAVRVALSQSHHMPLGEFVALYVRLRHPHHYDPSSWPVALWISFLWPFPLAVWAARKNELTPVRRETYRIFLLIVALLAMALLGAGVWYVSEPLIQMSLFRFSVYAKLLTCAGTAYVLCGAFTLSPVRRGEGRVRGLRATGQALTKWRSSHAYPSPQPSPLSTGERGKSLRWPWLVAMVALATFAAMFIRHNAAAENFLAANRAVLLLFLALCAGVAVYGWLSNAPLRTAMAALLLLLSLGIGWRHLGIRVLSDTADSADYLIVCDWVRGHTPVDAVFLVPPQEESFRLHAQRAIVVNFKCVPQLSGELGEWRDRLQEVLDLPNLRMLPPRFDLALAAIGKRYDSLSGVTLEAAARRYGATYILATHPLADPHLRHVFEYKSYCLYAVN